MKKINKKLKLTEKCLIGSKQFLYTKDILGAFHISKIYRRFFNMKMFGPDNITDQIVIQDNIKKWGNESESFYNFLIKKYHINYLLKSFGLIYSKCYDLSYDIRNVKTSLEEFPEDIILDINYTGIAAELMSKSLKFLLERIIKENNTSGKKMYLSNKDYNSFLTYLLNWSLLGFYNSRNSLSKTSVKTKIYIYPIETATINSEINITGTCTNENMTRTNYNPGLFNEISDDFNNAFKKQRGLYFSEYDNFLSNFLKYFKRSKSNIVELSYEEFQTYLKNVIITFEFEKIIRENCLTIDDMDKVDPKHIYKSVNKNRMDIKPFIIINDKVLCIKGLIHNSLQIWRNVYNQGMLPYGSKDLITTEVEKLNLLISEKFLTDVIKIFKDMGCITHKNVEYGNIFSRQPINYGDYDVIAINKEQKVVYNVEVKYIGTSLTASGLENDLYDYYKKNGHAYKCNRRNSLLLDNKKLFLEYFDIPNYELRNIMVISKPLDVKIKDEDYNFITLCYSMLKKYLNNKDK